MIKSRADVSPDDIHKDFLGREVMPNDYVLIAAGGWSYDDFTIAKVTTMTGKMVKLRALGCKKERTQYANTLLKISEEDVIMRTLKYGSK